MFLLFAGVFIWGALASATPGELLASAGVWFLLISVACSAVTYGCTLFLAPAADSA